MNAIDELVASVGFTAEDSAALRLLWPAAQARAHDLTRHFYQVVLRFDGAPVVRDQQQVERLTGTLATWLQDLCLGPHDHAYCERRRKIAEAQARVGLKLRSMFTAMSVLRGDLILIAENTGGESAAATRNALIRITDLDVAIMLGAYLAQHDSLENGLARSQHVAAMGSLASIVAHEVRNPLAGISGTVQVVASSMDPSDERREALVRVQDQVIRLGDLVGDLLAFSQPHEVHSEDLVLLRVAAAVTRQVDGASRGATTVEGSGRAHADPILLTQALFNIVENAWQAGAQRVTVQIEDGCVRVVDDGPGFAAEVAARLFEPFFTTKVRGTGLGLPIAQKIIEAMGGDLSLCASPLGGAGFLLRVPFAKDVVAQNAK